MRTPNFRSGIKINSTPVRTTPKRLRLGSQPKNPQTPESAKNKKVKTPKGSQTKSAKNKAKQINRQVYFSCVTERFKFQYCKVGLASRRPS